MMSEKKMHYIKRFGTTAIEKGYISIEQLIEALAIQVKDEVESGSHRLLGSILFEQDIITGDQLQDVIDSVLNPGAVAA
jgi:hypothetical protein